MGGGGKSRGGGSVPGFVRETSQALGERSGQLFDLARPLLEQGTGQIASLIRTGGPGANVPILNNAIAAQQQATRSALDQIAGDAQRSGLGAPFANRLAANVGQRGATVASRIPVEAAAPLIGASISGAFSGGQAAQQGFTGATRALAGGLRQPIRSAAAQNAGRNLFRLATGIGGGAFGGGGKGQAGPVPLAGQSPGGGFLVGPGGLLGGRV